VLQAENGQDALRLFEASGEKIDLLMADVIMLDLSGREVAEALQVRAAASKSDKTNDLKIGWCIRVV
jgi:CheY-like chemotaxis protein